MLKKTGSIRLAYVVIFGAMVLLLVSAQVLVWIGFKKRTVTDVLLSISAEESMVSQKVTMTCVSLHLKKDEEEQVKVYQNRLKHLLTRWENINDDLQNDNSYLNQVCGESKVFEGLYKKIAPFYKRIFEEAEWLSKNPHHRDSQQSIEIILINERLFLNAMKEFVSGHQKDAKVDADHRNLVQRFLEATVLILLLFKFVFIFSPAFMGPGTLNRQFLIESDKRKAELEEQKEKAKLLAILQGEEQERIRVSMELHDGVGQWLTAMKIHLKTWEKQDSGEANKAGKHMFEKLENLLEGTSNEIKRISNNLTPKLLNDFGLTEAIRNLTHTIFGETEVKMDINISLDEKRYTNQVQSFLFRMVQEVLNNISKHAFAKQVNLNLFEKGRYLFLNVRDDGKGFDLKDQEISKKNTSGLMNLRRRVQLLNGDFNINAAIGKGCEILIKIPID